MVDYSDPPHTNAIGGPSSALRYTWMSAPLVDEQEHLFVVRVATDAHPDRLETQNTDEHAATADAKQPEAPELTVQVV